MATIAAHRVSPSRVWRTTVFVCFDQKRDAAQRAQLIVLAETFGDSLAVVATTRNLGVVSRRSARGSVTVKIAPPAGLLAAAMVPLCASTIRRAIVRPMPTPCDLVVTNGCEQPVDDIRPQARSSVAYGDFDVAGRDLATDRDVTLGPRCLGHRVHGVDHQVHEHLLQQHRIATDDSRDSKAD